MSANRHTARESVRKAAAAAFEALPAVLLAAALLMPALAAIAGRTTERAEPVAPAAEVGRAIADQGNRALAEIREQARESLRPSLAQPKLS
jgi:hypothetical protein